MCGILSIDALTYKNVFPMSKITILVFAPKQFLRFWTKNLDFGEIPKFVIVMMMQMYVSSKRKLVEKRILESTLSKAPTIALNNLLYS